MSETKHPASRDRKVGNHLKVLDYKGKKKAGGRNPSAFNNAWKYIDLKLSSMNTACTG
jgi:hypothetical protein